MSFSESTYRLFESYKAGDLSSEELADFEARIVADSEFKNEWELFKLTSVVTTEMGYIDIHDKVGADIAKIPHRPWLKWFLLSIVVVTGVVSVVLLQDSNLDDSDQSLAEQTIKEKHVGKTSPQTTGAIIEEPKVRQGTEVLTQDEGELKVQDETVSEGTSSLAKEKDDVEVSTTVALETSPEVGVDHESPEVVDAVSATTLPANEATTLSKPDCPKDDENTVLDTELIPFSDEYGWLQVDESTMVGGGETPHEFSIDGENFQSSPSFYDLIPGKYRVWARDGEGCVFELGDGVLVERDKCNSSFTPDASLSSGMPWTIPQSKEASGGFKVIAKSGLTLYASALNDSGDYTWDLSDKAGSRVSPGFYKFIITYDDGLTCSGRVTVFE